MKGAAAAVDDEDEWWQGMKRKNVCSLFLHPFDDDGEEVKKRLTMMDDDRKIDVVTETKKVEVKRQELFHQLSLHLHFQ